MLTHKKKQITIREDEERTLLQIGIDFSSTKRTTLTLVPPSEMESEPVPSQQRRKAVFDGDADSTVPDDLDLALGASASPVETESSIIPLPLFGDEPTSSSNDNALMYPSKFGYLAAVYVYRKCGVNLSCAIAITATSRPSSGFVGLVNQAMTCYLNSLLQALYMTPEFRNALYNWESGDGSDPNKNIPFQLQKLFVNLQVNFTKKNYRNDNVLVLLIHT